MLIFCRINFCDSLIFVFCGINFAQIRKNKFSKHFFCKQFFPYGISTRNVYVKKSWHVKKSIWKVRKYRNKLCPKSIKKCLGKDVSTAKIGCEK